MLQAMLRAWFALLILLAGCAGSTPPQPTPVPTPQPAPSRVTDDALGGGRSAEPNISEVGHECGIVAHVPEAKSMTKFVGE